MQARTRGTLLMAISNKTGAMVVTTGNKSEMSVGYATLYGDMNGGFNPIKDIYKTEVFRLSSLRNSWKPEGALGPSGEVIPATSSRGRRPRNCARTRPTRIRCRPTTCSTPSWSGWSSARSRWPSIVAAGFDREVVTRIDRLLNIAEYKRRQAAPGVKVTQPEFRPRPPLSHHQQVSRRRQAVARTRRHAGVAREPRIGGSVRGLGNQSECRLESARGNEGRSRPSGVGSDVSARGIKVGPTGGSACRPAAPVAAAGVGRPARWRPLVRHLSWRKPAEPFAGAAATSSSRSLR